MATDNSRFLLALVSQSSQKFLQLTPGFSSGNWVQNSSPGGGRGNSFPTSSSPLTNNSVIRSRKRFQCKLWACFFPVPFCFDTYRGTRGGPSQYKLVKGKAVSRLLLLGFKLFQEIKHTSNRNAAFSFAAPATQTLHP